MDIVKTQRINNLLDLYKDLLTDKQQEVMDMYFLYDLSLAEIAEEQGITRASVLDTLKQASKKLEEFENTLHLLEKREKIKKILNSELEKEEILNELERIL